MKKTLSLLLSLCLSAGWAPASAAAESGEPHPLAARILALKRHPACRGKIALEWVPSWPVPARDGGSGQYKVFFHAVIRAKKGGQVALAPAVEATLPVESAGEPACRTLPGAARDSEAGPPLGREAKALDFAELMRRRSRLYELTESVARLYLDSKTDAQARAAAAEYLAAFKLLMAPGLVEEYRKLNPEFWTWIEAQGGKKL